MMCIKIKAMIGSKITWPKKPTIKSRGYLFNLLKSAIVRPRPKPNIIIIRQNGAIVFAISITIF